MYRSKRLLAAVLCAAGLFSSAVAEGESANILYRESAEETNVETAQVTRGEFSQKFSGDAAPYYPHTCKVRVEVSGARFVEYKVKNGDTVKAGDVLVIFTREVDEVALERKRLALKRGEENYAARLADWDETIADMYDDLSMTTEPLLRERKKLEIERAELQRDKYVHETEYELERMREDIAEIEEDYGVTEIVAPMDGVIRIEAYKQAGQRMSNGEVLMTITGQHGMLFGVENKSGYFRFGMEVTVEVGGNGNRVTVPGKVVATDMVIPEASRKHHAVIWVDPAALEGVKMTRPRVTAQSYYLDNVLILPKTAVKLSDGKYSIVLWQDGKPAKRYINFAMSAQSVSFILDGVEEGATVIVD